MCQVNSQGQFFAHKNLQNPMQGSGKTVFDPSLSDNFDEFPKSQSSTEKPEIQPSFGQDSHSPSSFVDSREQSHSHQPLNPNSGAREPLGLNSSLDFQAPQGLDIANSVRNGSSMSEGPRNQNFPADISGQDPTRASNIPSGNSQMS